MVHAIDKDFAIATWKQRGDAVQGSLGHAIQYGLAALRAAQLINGAAAAALLTFVSANHAKIPGQGPIRVAWFAFVTGMLLPALAAGLSYLSQGMFMKSTGDYTLSF